MNKIFISYRREDSEGFARGLFQSLVGRLGKNQVFMDVEAIEPGIDFIEAIDKNLVNCAAILVLIGKQWLHCTDAEGTRRLDTQDDFVRIEIAKAIKRNVRVIPVLVKGASMPKAEELPEELASLARRQALELSHERWDRDVEHLVSTLERVLDLKHVTQDVVKGQSHTTPSQSAKPTDLSGKKTFKAVGLIFVAIVILGLVLYSSLIDKVDDRGTLVTIDDLKSTKLEIVQNWQLLIKDSMHTNAIGWAENSDYNDDYVRGKRIFSNNCYHWEIKGKKDQVWIKNIPRLDPEFDFYACLEFQKVDECATQVILIFRRSGHNYYTFRIDSKSSSFKLNKHFDNKWKDIVGWTTSSSIIPKGKNTMGVIAEGDKISLFINDVLVSEASDDQLKNGNIGIGVEINRKNDTAVYNFTNFELRRKPIN